MPFKLKMFSMIALLQTSQKAFRESEELEAGTTSQLLVLNLANTYVEILAALVY